MIRSPPEIKRPRLLGALALLAVAAGASACLSVLAIAAKLEDAPLGIRAGTQRLEATLATAELREPGRGGPVIWLATAPDCAACAAYTRQAITELQQDGYEVRVLTLMPGGDGSRHNVLRAVAEQNGASMQLPALFWRHGGEWRASFGNGRDPRQSLRADLSPGA